MKSIIIYLRGDIMEMINSNITEDDFLKAKSEYTDLKWKLMFEKFSYEEEKEQIIEKISKLNEEWEIEED